LQLIDMARIHRLFIVLLWSIVPLVSVAFVAAPQPNALLRSSLSSHVAYSQANPIQTKASKLASTADGQAEKSVQVDYDALVKYHASIGIQMSIFAVSLTALDTLVDAIGMQVPFPAVAALFYGLSLKSRTFNPLNTARPNMVQATNEEKASGFRDRVMPSWTPPGVIFPIMWLLIIGPLRAYSSALVYETTGHFMHPAILSFLFHLSVGDVWNTINNTEKRHGASVTGVMCVVASLLYAAYQYHSVDPLAGSLLGLTVIWLSVACSLITATWKLNPNSSGEKDPLYPVVGGSKTEFIWLQK
jgi:tryptophan-rich sensory protein